MTVRCVTRIGLLITVVLCGMWVSQHSLGSEPAKPTESLEQCFVSPRDADKPWAYWWWINGNVDKATITHDLEQMKEKGFAGLLLFDVRGYHDDLCPPPPPRMEFMSTQWRELIRFAISEASRVGLEMSINLSSCAGALKGPWLVQDDAPKRLIWTSADVSGPSQLKLQLGPSGDPGFRDVALFAMKSVTAAKPPGAAATGVAEKLSGNWQAIQPQLNSEGIESDVIDLSKNLDNQGQLTWAVPEGNWTLVRFARSLMAGHEYDVDVLDPTAVASHFRRMGERLLEDAGRAAQKTLTHFYSVSWEVLHRPGPMGWRKDFRNIEATIHVLTSLSWPVRRYGARRFPSDSCVITSRHSVICFVTISTASCRPSVTSTDSNGIPSRADLGTASWLPSRMLTNWRFSPAMICRRVSSGIWGGR